MFTEEDYKLIEREFEGLRESSRKRCVEDEQYELVLKAFEFANEAHKGVRRRSGEPYILHPIAVAKIVVDEIGLGCKSICASSSSVTPSNSAEARTPPPLATSAW